MKQYDTACRRAAPGPPRCPGDALRAGPVVSPYILSLLIGALFAAFLGQAWNFMMGFAGQLSLGHSLYIGLGAYSARSCTNLGIPPWFGMLVAIAIWAASAL